MVSCRLLLTLLFALVTGASLLIVTSTNAGVVAEESCFVVVEARWKSLSPSAKSRIEDARKDLKNEKLTQEQFDKKLETASKGLPLELLGYLDGQPLALEVKRAEAAERQWSLERFPVALVFQKRLSLKSSATVFQTPMMSLPKEGWIERTCGNDPGLRYRIHPWLDSTMYKRLTDVLDGKVKDVKYEPAQTFTTPTALGVMTVGGSPEQWVVTVLVQWTMEGRPEGRFAVETPDGVKLGEFEIDKPIEIGAPHVLRIPLYERPPLLTEVRLRPLTARLLLPPATPADGAAPPSVEP